MVYGRNKFSGTKCAKNNNKLNELEPEEWQNSNEGFTHMVRCKWSETRKIIGNLWHYNKLYY